ncbi:MAG: hypothetical protein IPM66_07920 [Acidobacteriota bacterium]|nr:MAG: hypothetical protein IPM66_07920 [Acidobacteriota bacterium]
MRGTPDLVDLINDRRSKRYLNDALVLTCQELSGCGDVEPEVMRDRRLAHEADDLLNEPNWDFSLAVDY